MQYKSIRDMQIGEESKIIDMTNMNNIVRHRFLDLGIAPDAQVRLIKRINFNQLYIIEIDDVEICIRQKDAKNIIIQDN